MSIQYKNRTFQLALNRGHDTRQKDRTQRDRKNNYERYNHEVGRGDEVYKTQVLALPGLVAWR